jgi:peptide-methionine (R)-S-oxide reductase
MMDERLRTEIAMNRRAMFSQMLLGGAALAFGGPLLSTRAFAFAVTRTDADWKKMLPPESYQVLRHEGTEYAFSSPLDHNFKKGSYACLGCDLTNFSSDKKFDSGTGWPSFWAPIPGTVETKHDLSVGMDRTEVHCTRCGGHLGHVFPDGPKPTGLRYCMNGVALKFTPAAA